MTFEGESIAWIAQWSVTDARKWVEALTLAGRDAEIARDVVSEIRSRLEFLEEVGLGYLTLDRAAPTLSGGEAQRIRLAAQLGSNLQGVCYVLDEPTIGLHSRDNAILLNALQNLGRQGQHAGRRRARRGDDPARRPHHRHRPGRGQARRPAGGRRQRERALVACRFGHRPLPRPSARAPAAAAAPGRDGDGGDRAQGEREQFAADDPRRDAAQPAGRDRRPAAASAWSRSPASAARASRRSRATCCSPTCSSSTRAARGRAGRAARRSTAGATSTAFSRSTRRRSARRRARARRPTSASGTRSASCSPRRSSRRRAATRRRASASTPARAAARAAKGRA